MVETLRSRKVSNGYTLLEKTDVSEAMYIINRISILQVTLRCISGAGYVGLLFNFSQSRPSYLSSSQHY